MSWNDWRQLGVCLSIEEYSAFRGVSYSRSSNCRRSNSLSSSLRTSCCRSSRRVFSLWFQLQYGKTELRTPQALISSHLNRMRSFSRVRELENVVLLVPDDRLESPSLMLQILAVPGRVDILKVRSGGGGLRWTLSAIGSCNGASGDCAPGPQGCCGWHWDQDDASDGWVCRCP